MKGDFTRDTFDPGRNFLRVLMQQGRVQLDADWNEQTSILLHYLQALAADLIGPHGGVGDAFKIAVVTNNDNTPDLTIVSGRYYVQGLLCENVAPVDANGKHIAVTFGGTGTSHGQPYYTPDLTNLPDPPVLVYLDVWERHLSGAEDADLLEVALGGPDTTTRSQLVWQVKVAHITEDARTAILPSTDPNKDPYKAFLQALSEAKVSMTGTGMGTGRLRAQAKIDETQLDNPCILSPDARYRGAENQLYRVEIHTGGTAGGNAKAMEQATFKWSRENGSVTFPIVSREAAVFTLEHLGLDAGLGLQPGDYVEVCDDDTAFANLPAPLLKVSSTDPTEMTVTLESEPSTTIGDDVSKHPLLRRWDQKAGAPNRGGLRIAKDGAAQVVESGGAAGTWLELEDGIQIQFQTGGEYLHGDYWLIPARVATGNVLWPPPGQTYAALAHGVAHYYAPLAIITKGEGGGTVGDCRRKINQVAS